MPRYCSFSSCSTFAWVITLATLFSCQSDVGRFGLKTNELPPVNISLRDYASVLFELDTTNLAEHLKNFQPDFYPFLGDKSYDSVGLRKIKNFVTDTLAKRLYYKAKDRFSSNGEWKSKLELSLRRFHYLFPQVPIPTFFTYISNVQIENAIITGATEMLVALDCFLGEDEPTYNWLGIPRYIAVRMTPEHLLPAIWSAMFEAYLEDRTPRTRVIDEMVASGKKYLFMEVMLPDVPDHILFGVKPEKMEWLRKHEGELWLAIIEEGLLYSTDPLVLRKLFADGPFTADFSYDSPARIGEWIGWQIMRSYARQHKDKSLAQLLDSGDAQSILSKSRYKPRK